jgi:drug/metabolite transporter (DMT)-like permease
MTVEALPYVVLLAFFFGTSLIASRFSVGQFEPLAFIGLRLTLAGLGSAAIYAMARRRRWPRDHRLWRHAILLGIFGTALPMTAVMTALQHQSGGITALLITASPAVTVLLAHFFLPDETLTRLKAAGVLFALGGAALLALQGESGLADSSEASSIGYILVLVAMVASSVMTIYARKFMQDLDAFDVASVRMWSAALAIMPLSLLLFGVNLGRVDGWGYFALIYSAIFGTFAGFLLAFYNIKRFGATAAAMTSYVIPLITGSGGVLLLGETVTPMMIVGMVIIISGVAFINRGTV